MTAWNASHISTSPFVKVKVPSCSKLWALLSAFLSQAQQLPCEVISTQPQLQIQLLQRSPNSEEPSLEKRSHWDVLHPESKSQELSPLSHLSSSSDSDSRSHVSRKMVFCIWKIFRLTWPPKSFIPKWSTPLRSTDMPPQSSKVDPKANFVPIGCPLDQQHQDHLEAYQKCRIWSSSCGSAVTNLNGIHEDVGSIPGQAQWVKDPALPCGIGCRCSSDSTLLWLWHKPEAAASIRPLARELPYTVGSALKSRKEKKKKKRKEKERKKCRICIFT